MNGAGKVVVREATADDFPTYFDQPVPENPWLALVAERDGEFVGGGGLIWFDGEACVFFDLKSKTPPITVHRAALTFLDDCRAVGINRIWAGCDRRAVRAKKWLDSLGFRYAPAYGDVWLWRA